MIITLVVFLFIAVSQAQENCADKFEFVPEKSLSAHLVDSQKTFTIVDELSAKKLVEQYSQIRMQPLQPGNQKSFNFYTVVRPRPENDEPSQIRGAVSDVEYFVKQSMTNLDGIKVDYSRNDIQCKPVYFPSNYYFFKTKKSVMSLECVASVCLTATEYNQSSKSTSSRGVSSLRKK